MTTKIPRFPNPAGHLVAGVAMVVGGVFLLAVKMQPPWAAMHLGPICTHPGILALHCWGCYVAAAEIAAGLGLGLGALGASVLEQRGGAQSV